MNYLNYLIDWIKLEVNHANANGVVLGLSGGIDSALVAYLAKQAFPSNSLALILPINKNREFDIDDAISVAQKFKLNYQIINLENEYLLLKNKFNIDSNLINGNVQSRLRMLTIYAFAQKNNYLVLGTDNKAEYELGYFTKYGDGGCDLLPIVHLYKSEVFAFAKEIGVPKQIINKKPSAGFWDGQFDENELGFSYDDYELWDKNELNNDELCKKIEHQIKITNHKRKPIRKPKSIKEI